MIYLIQGRPRSGKSYEAVKYHVIPAIKSGRKVITNLPLNIAYFKKVLGDHVEDLICIVDNYDTADFASKSNSYYFSQPEHYQDDWRDEDNRGPLFVIDECQFCLPRGGTLPEVKKFYTMHGHYGVDILLITQHIRQTDNDVLNLVEVVYKCTKNTALGSSTTYTKKVQDGYRGAVVNVEQRKYDKKIFPYYKSHTQSSSTVNEATASDVKPIWKHWSVIGSVVLLGGVLIFVLSGGVRSPFAMKERVEVVQEVEQTAGESEKVVDGNQSGQKQSAAKKSRPHLHPLDEFVLYVTGHSRQIAIRQDNKFDLDLSFDRVYLEAYQNNLRQFALTSDDLRKMGYTINQMGDCIYSLNYEGFDSIVVCNTSRELEMGSPSSFLSI